MHNAQAAAVNLFWMSHKRSRNPQLKAFGGWLAELRSEGVSRERISIRLRGLGVPLGGSTLAQYEKGTVWAPDPCVMWGLAKIYGVGIEKLVAGLRLNRENPSIATRDLLRRVNEVVSASPAQQGASDVLASARIRELEDRLFANEVIVQNARRLAGELMATTGAKGGEALQRTTRRRNRN